MGRKNMVTEMYVKSSLALYRDTNFRGKKRYSVAGGRNVEVARNYKENRYREMPVAVR
jgi:hypothetical protein